MGITRKLDAERSIIPLKAIFNYEKYSYSFIVIFFFFWPVVHISQIKMQLK